MMSLSCRFCSGDAEAWGASVSAAAATVAAITVFFIMGDTPRKVLGPVAIPDRWARSCSRRRRRRTVLRWRRFFASGHHEPLNHLPAHAGHKPALHSFAVPAPSLTNAFVAVVGLPVPPFVTGVLE